MQDLHIKDFKAYAFFMSLIIHCENILYSTYNNAELKQNYEMDNISAN